MLFLWIIYFENVLLDFFFQARIKRRYAINSNWYNLLYKHKSLLICQKINMIDIIHFIRYINDLIINLQTEKYLLLHIVVSNYINFM